MMFDRPLVYLVEAALALYCLRTLKEILFGRWKN